MVRAKDACHADLQVVVTTRPSVFGTVPEIPDSFRGSLGALSPARTEQYSDKWVKARSLEVAEADEVKRVLREKVGFAHIRELTRNPMQLAIMLNLIHTIGRSLPDRRTDLYTRYLDIFLTREAEKSTHVRDNRDLLLDFVSFLAWHLQCRAELPKNSGSIGTEDLLALVRDYLRKTGHSEDLAGALFHGGLDRIFVLVQRIERFYEFEVQPLREYFCARHLFKTAPAATHRDPIVNGDHAQRFEAMAANPFWLNVVRFYAGFYDRGLLSSLLYSISDMLSLRDVAQALQARRVGYALVADSVFSGKPLVQNDVVLRALDALACDTLRTFGVAGETLALAEGCGRDVFAESLFLKLQTLPLSARAAHYCALIRENGGSRFSGDFQKLVEVTKGPDRTMWIDRMARSGAVDPDHLAVLNPESECDLFQLGRRYSSLLNFAPFLVDGSPYSARALECVLDGVVQTFDSSTPLSTTASIIAKPLAASELAVAFRDTGAGGPLNDTCRDFIRRYAHASANWRHNEFVTFKADAAATAIDVGEEVFGKRWCFLSAAVRYAGMPGAGRGATKASLLHSGATLSARARAARLRRGSAGAWKADLQMASTSEDLMFWAAMVGAWTSPSVLELLWQDLATITDQLSPVDFKRVAFSIRGAVREGGRSDRTRLGGRSTVVRTRIDLLWCLGFSSLAPDTKVDGSPELVDEVSDFLAERRLETIAASDPGWDSGLTQRADWHRAMELVESEDVPSGARSRPQAAVAVEVLRRHNGFPIGMVQEATSSVLSRYRAKRVGSISDEQHWVFD